MRAFLLSDLVSTARVLHAVPETERRPLLNRLITQSHYADVFFRKLGYPHPRWGNGALGSAARGYPAGRRCDLTDPEFCDCLLVVLEGIRAFRNRPT
ncbi:hypothetical protein [uncultured Roseobacter sp.]|uniref:DUF7742 family protein n=1 Tax=uncultured Roseobacter sp. TaxID=114847 RepID=UPI0026225DCF|nr:hypothetical protein [uncultured Roseobacter sp.]